MLFAAALLSAGDAAQPQDNVIKPHFVIRDAFEVMGLQTENPYEGDNMMRIWTNFMEIEHKIPEIVGKASYGVSYAGEEYNPDTMEGMYYFVGDEVKPETEMPEGFMRHKVPGAYYAVFEHKGKIDYIGKTYDYIYNIWLPKTNTKIVDQDSFELYDDRFIPNSDKSVMEIWIPVLKPEIKPAEN